MSELAKHKLSQAQMKALVFLKEHNGSGYIDTYGRVIAGGAVYARDAWLAWLNLIARGYVDGAEGRLRVTAMGEEAYREIISSRKTVARTDHMITRGRTM